jgi:hypothetical protein
MSSPARYFYDHFTDKFDLAGKMIDDRFRRPRPRALDTRGRKLQRENGRVGAYAE